MEEDRLEGEKIGKMERVEQDEDNGERQGRRR